ncbi:MAG: Cas10/Cmr2 second palm domain-containing protein [Promethearchaeota archaeon]
MSERRERYIRGFFIPKYDESSNIFFRTIEISDKINKLDFYLDHLLKLFKKIFPSPIDNEKDLDLFNNIYVLLIYASLSIPWEQMFNIWLEFLSKESSQVTSVKDMIKNEFKEIKKIIYEFYDLFPADDRPGFNTSSLLIHSLSTSALGVAIAINYKDSEKYTNLDIQILRTASFFHDIGKPVSSENHIDNSIECLKKYFSQLFSNTILDKIIVHIQNHHAKNPSGLTRFLKQGDQLSSATDRLNETVIKIFSKKFENFQEQLNKREFWKKHSNELEDLTENFLEEYQSIVSEQDIPPIFQNEGELALIRGDVRKIHNYIEHVDSLQELRHASGLLDYHLTTSLVLDLLKNDSFILFPEMILYSSGGNIILFSSGKDAKSITDYLEIRFPEFFKKGLEMTAEFLYFDHTYNQSFGKLYSDLNIKLNVKKNDLHHKNLKPILFGSVKICQSCGQRAADTLYQDKFLCNSCNFKLRLSTKDPFIESLKIQTIWDKNIFTRYSHLLNGWNWDKIKDNILEFLSGNTLEEIQQIQQTSNKINLRKLAIIKSDGNLIGEFISNSISLSDLYTRIIHTSNTMIEIFNMLINKNYLNEIDKVRLDIGKIYIGGDDILLITPAYLSIPITLILATEFFKKMGGQCSLSSGIFLCSPKFPIWNAFEIAEDLLKEAKKQIYPLLINIDKKENQKYIGAIDFQSEFTGRHYPKKKILQRYSNRPYLIALNDSKKNIFSFINLLLESYLTSANTFNDFHQLAEKLYKMNIDKENSNYKNLNDLRKKIKKVSPFFIESAQSMEISRMKASSFVMYQTIRQKSELGRKSYLKIFELLGTQFSKDPILLYDALELIRFLSGGDL